MFTRHWMQILKLYKVSYCEMLEILVDFSPKQIILKFEKRPVLKCITSIFCTKKHVHQFVKPSIHTKFEQNQTKMTTPKSLQTHTYIYTHTVVLNNPIIMINRHFTVQYDSISIKNIAKN